MEYKCQCQCQSNAQAIKVEASKNNFVFWGLSTLAAIIIWFALYSSLEDLSKWIVSFLPISPETHLAEAATFFFYDTPKVLMLLALITFVMGIVRSFFSPERTRTLLAGKHEGLGNIAAACFGIVTPFCSCSAVSLFIGFVSAGVPLGVTFSFLISAPMVNEVALGLLFGLLGWKVALSYLFFGLGIAIIAGWIMGKLNLEGGLEDWVRQTRSETAGHVSKNLTAVDRIKEGLNSVREIVGKVWIWMIAGIAVGALIHGYAPADILANIMGKEAWWSVPAAVALGVPMYSNAAGVIPVVEALLGKGAALGTVLAFMMSVTALSLPEAIILRKVLSLRLIAVYFSVVACGILAVGFLFNALFL